MKTCAAIEHHLPCAMLQYNPAPGSHGSVKFLYARIADIFMGTIITSLFTLVLPWSVPPPHHSLQQSHHLPSTVTFSSPPTCLHPPPPPPPFPFPFPPPPPPPPSTVTFSSPPLCLPPPPPPLTFSRPSSCLNSPSICLQQSPYLPSTVPPLAYSGLSTCLQQLLHLPSATPPLAFSSPYIGLHRSLHLPSADPVPKSTWSCSVLLMSVTCECAAHKAMTVASS